MAGRRVLVTRPEPQATVTASLLRARGHVAHKCPVARIERLAPALPPAEAVDAIILTSANAAFALAAYADLPVFAVGEATARAARAAGAGQVTVALGDWQSLARLLAGSDGPPAGARLLHLSGAEVRGDLAGAASAAGFVVERRVVYAARAVDWLDRATLALLAGEALDAVLFFSPAHATIWRRLVDRAAIADRLFPLAAIALSEAVAEPLKILPWRRLGVAAAPEVARLIDRLEAMG
jgi:uroporphyrinogen-III synthase